MRIEIIEIAWFRGAAEAIQLDTKSKSMVVYGENGSGKSCFVDAIEYPPNGSRIEHLAHEYSGKRQEKAIINIGSVGQPRDRDVRACFVVVHEKGEKVPYPPDVGPGDTSPQEEGYVGTFEFVRVEYDIQKAVQKALDTPDLDDFLGLRLLEGR